MESGAARDQHLDVWSCSEQICEEHASRQHLLEVVQKEQKLLVAEIACQPLGKGLTRHLPDVQRLCDGCNHERSISDWGEIDEDDAVRKLVMQHGGGLQGQPGLADAAGTGQG